METLVSLRDATAGYAREHRPLVAYAGLTVLFNLTVAGILLGTRSSGRSLPERIGLGDVLLLGVATFKLSRLIAKDSVTSFVRAPFVAYEGPAGDSEVNEKPRGTGWRLALGELLTCPFCVGQWVAASLAGGLVVAPALTRFVGAIFAFAAVADFLQLVYSAEKERRAGPEGSISLSL